MINTMYSVIDGVCQVTGELTGVKISIPRPSKRALTTSYIANGVTGTSLVLFGLLTPHKWAIILGGTGIAASLAMKAEIKKMG
ncbi:hypothetical protein I6N95_07040 [Vagococcus sp. BWB3-3]|uniref:Uncharacterized protein n=1 Tax=Vagococcus allomyrinae TaxID=2794353 RepID=A0A940STX5_9ENTE|nr:hypothetical protein [Vagococcus allomyrinae]MBP1040755.1 hypothetical protein [Vagococcus allomyrinae]